jgi:hypothetical protein
MNKNKYVGWRKILGFNLSYPKRILGFIITIIGTYFIEYPETNLEKYAFIYACVFVFILLNYIWRYCDIDMENSE